MKKHKLWKYLSTETKQSYHNYLRIEKYCSIYRIYTSIKFPVCLRVYLDPGILSLNNSLFIYNFTDICKKN